MQTLTYTIGKDKRELTSDLLSAENFTVDWSTATVKNWVQAREYERNMRQVEVHVNYDDGTPVDLTGTNPWFEGLTHDLHKVIDAEGAVPIDPVNGIFRFDFPAQAFAVAGSYKQAFFRIMKDGASVTTLEFDLTVLADMVIGGLISSDYVTPLEDIVNRMNAKKSDIEKWYVTAQQELTDLETKIKADGLLTQSELDTEFGKPSDLKPQGANFVAKINNELNDQYVNIKWFGAIDDGTTDDTQAMTDAIKYAQDNNLDKVYIPDGQYVLNPETPYLIKNISIIGKSKYTSQIITGTTVFDVSTYGIVENLTIEKNVNDVKPIISLGGIAGSSLYGMRLLHLHIGGSKVASSDVGNCLTIGIKFNLDGMGLCDTSIEDVQATYVYTGLQIDSTAGGWMTGCDFQGLTKQFSHSAFELISSTNEMKNGVYTMSKFSWTAEVSGTVPEAVGYIIAGSNNEFHNLRLFQDGTYSGIAIQLSNQSTEAGPGASFAGGHTNFNVFIGGHLEGRIDDPEGIFEMQYWRDLMAIGYYKKNDDGTDDMSTGHAMMIHNQYHPNLISDPMAANLYDSTKFAYQTAGSSYRSGADEHGRYIEITAGSKTTPVYIPLAHQVELLNALQDGPFALGMKIKDIGNTIGSITDSPIRGYLIFNGQQVPRTLDSQSYSKPLASDTQYKELIWNYSKNSDWFTNTATNNYKEAFYMINVDAGSHIRVYDIEIVKGCIADLSLVQHNTSFFLPIDSGGRNYLQKANIALTGTDVSNIEATGKSCTVDVAGLNYQKNRYLTISADVDLNNYTATGSTRLFLYAEVILTFEDQTTMAINCGVTNVDHTLVRGRISAFKLLPEKKILSATAAVGVTGGTHCDYYCIANPQLETGTVASDYHTSIN